jgi:very-short-patch-repair endonuclease
LVDRRTRTDGAALLSHPLTIVEGMDLSHLLPRQHSLVGRHQVDRDDWRSVTRSRSFEELSPRVQRLRGSMPTPGQLVLAPVLDGGSDALLWGVSGERWWGFGRDFADKVQVGRARPSHHIVDGALGEWHRVGTIEPEHRMRVDEVPVASAELLVYWHARLWRLQYANEEWVEERVGNLLDRAWRMGFIRPDVLRDLAASRDGSGNAGNIAFRNQVARRPPGYQPTDSALEERFEHQVGPFAGRLRRQVHVGADHPIGRVDFLAIDAPLVTEINSERFHSSLTDREADAIRYDQLIDAGFSVLVLWEHDVWYRSADAITAAVRTALSGDRPRLFQPFPPPWSRTSVA